MSEPFLAEIRPFAFSFAPRGWAECNGQLLPINQNQSVFSLVGTFYGGDGRTTFGLPELRGRTPVHEDSANGLQLGERDGQETQTLTTAHLPAHTHEVAASSNPGASRFVSNNVLAGSGTASIYGVASNLVATNAAAVGETGQNQQHPNMQPYLTLNYCIALQGLFPSRN